jgi:hypothetical protein
MVLVNGDAQPERDEDFVVKLSKAENAQLDDRVGIGKIADDDLPTIASLYDNLITSIQSLPSDAFKKPADRWREQLINSVKQSRSLFDRGKLNAAEDVLQHSVLNHLTGSGPDAWIVQDAVRQDLAQQTSDLVGLLAQQVVLASRHSGEEIMLELEESPKELALAQNYPNPFNPSTTIEYRLAKETHVSLKVYSMLGEVVATLVDRDEGPGIHQVKWKPGLASGTYIYRLEAADFVATKRMVLLK